MSLNPFRYKGPLDQVQYDIWKAVNDSGYSSNSHDCSNKSYMLWHLWTRLSMEPKIYLCHWKNQLHAQVELPGLGFYDPALNSKIEVKKLGSLSPANTAKKLPSRVEFWQYLDTDYILDTSNNEFSIGEIRAGKIIRQLRKHERHFTYDLPLKITTVNRREW